jgi:stage IV sporulation protein B
MQQESRFRFWRLLLAVAVSLACLSPPVQRLAESPVEVSLPLGECLRLPLGWRTVSTSTSDARIVQATSDPDEHGATALSLLGKHPGQALVSTRIFGLIPWKTVRVQVVPSEFVYVGGQSIGIRLNTRGVMVIGYQRIGDHDSPAARAHVQIGDIIERVNGTSLNSVDDLERWLMSHPDELSLLLTVRRHGQLRTIRVQPVTDSVGKGHLGLYVRDRTSGVGTLTFYDPDSHRFGALGHVITDVDTGQPIEGRGSVFEAEVVGMVRGSVGRPGEKRGRFVAPAGSIGRIDKNTPFGVFGTMETTPSHLYLDHEVPVALPSQVHAGPAQMLTVVSGETVEAFQVEIENTLSQSQPATKSMIIHVTDPRLLRLTGGIVQGMSGSPVIQDGRLVGAVTHVFVSDPTRGYGVYAKWMLRQATHSRDEKPVMAVAAAGKGPTVCRKVSNQY